MEKMQPTGEFSVTADIEIFLRGREDPRRIRIKEGFEFDEPPEEDIDMHTMTLLWAEEHIMRQIDTNGMLRLIIADENENLHILMIDQIQSISVYPIGGFDG